MHSAHHRLVHWESPTAICMLLSLLRCIVCKADGTTHCSNVAVTLQKLLLIVTLTLLINTVIMAAALLACHAQILCCSVLQLCKVLQSDGYDILATCRTTSPELDALSVTVVQGGLARL